MHSDPCWSLGVETINKLSLRESALELGQVQPVSGKPLKYQIGAIRRGKDEIARDGQLLSLCRSAFWSLFSGFL
jgi:hypothetical protein